MLVQCFRVDLTPNDDAGVAAEGDRGGAAVLPGEIYPQRPAAGGDHRDRRFRQFERGGGDRAGDRASAARERFRFDSALVRPHSYRVSVAYGNDVQVRPSGRKHIMVSHATSDRDELIARSERIDVRNDGDRVRNANSDRMEIQVSPGRGEFNTRSERAGVGDGDADGWAGRVGIDPGMDQSAFGA